MDSHVSFSPFVNKNRYTFIKITTAETMFMQKIQHNTEWMLLH